MTAVIFTVFLTDQVQSQDKELCAGSSGIRVDTAGRALCSNQEKLGIIKVESDAELKIRRGHYRGCKI